MSPCALTIFPMSLTKKWQKNVRVCKKRAPGNVWGTQHPPKNLKIIGIIILKSPLQQVHVRQPTYPHLNKENSSFWRNHCSNCFLTGEKTFTTAMPPMPFWGAKPQAKAKHPWDFFRFFLRWLTRGKMKKQMDTPPKLNNIDPEKRRLEDYFPIGFR